MGGLPKMLHVVDASAKTIVPDEPGQMYQLKLFYS